MIKVKICGITNLEDAITATSAGADALGFIFTKKSPRYINLDEAEKIIRQLDPFTAKAGIFMDEEQGAVLEIASHLKLNVLQFHGKEGPAYCNFFRPKFKVIKVIFFDDAPLSKKIAAYKVDAFLFDIPYEDKQGGRKTLSAEKLKDISALIKSGYRVIISGGLNPKNVLTVKKFNPYAVDVASGVEKMVGKKDEDLVKEFIQKVKELR